MTKLKFASKTSDAQSIFLFMPHEMMDETGSSPTDMHLCIHSNTYPPIHAPTHHLPINPSVHSSLHSFSRFLWGIFWNEEMHIKFLTTALSHIYMTLSKFHYPSLWFFTGKYKKWPRLVVLNLLTTANFFKIKILLWNLNKVNEIAVLCVWNLENRCLESC